jgi:hypothetical protein
MLNSNQAFLLVQKLKSAPQGLYTWSQGWNRKKKIFNLPQVTNKLIPTFMALYWPPRLEKKKKKKKDTIEFGNPICNSWGQCSNFY